MTTMTPGAALSLVALKRLTCLIVATTLVLGGAAVRAEAAPATCNGQSATITGTNAGEDLRGTKKRDVIVGLGGHDDIWGLDGSDLICGGSEDDDVYGGYGNDSVWGEDGLDYLHGHEGDDRLFGGAGSDDLFGDRSFRWQGDDTLDGGPGGDWYRAAPSNKNWAWGVTVNLEGGTAVGQGQDRLSSLENVWGSNIRDYIYGNDDANYLIGGSGGDTIWALDGNDVIEGDGDGAANGNDDLFGGGGIWDLVAYFSASESIRVDLQQRRATGGGGRDALGGFELVIGSDHDDTLLGDARSNYLAGRGGDDHLDGRYGLDVATFYNPVEADLASGQSVGRTPPPGGFNEATDQLVDLEGLWGSDTDLPDELTGDDGANLLIGGSGNDTLSGAAGDDYFLQDDLAGADIVSGGVGTYDMVDYYWSYAGVEVDLVAGSDNFSSQLSGIEAVYGSEFDDVLTGDDQPNFLFGGRGDDTLEGAGGADQLFGDSDSDDLSGGADSDMCFDAEVLDGCESLGQPTFHPLWDLGDAAHERRYKRRYK